MRHLYLFFITVGLAACVQQRPTEPLPQRPASSSASSLESPIVSSKANTTNLPLVIPDGFAIDTFVDGLNGARVIVQDGFGNFWVSRPQAGVVTQLEMSGSTVARKNDVFRGLDRPHGLAVDPQNSNILYIAEETGISRAHLYSDAPLEHVAYLPAGGRHWTRMLGFGPDDRLYVSLGSTCDICVEKNPEIATIISMNRDGSDRKIVAKGLRNAVFFTWNPVDGSLWATDMGRDMLGDNLPPEEVNIVSPRAESRGDTPHYGWPYCYGQKIRDTSFPGTFNCSSTIPPHIELPAHIAPLGLTFIPEEGWPEEYWYDLLVAEHGSWNSSTRVGYKIIRIPLDAQGNPEGEPVDFVTGFLSGNRVLGRPVDVRAQPGGILYITDDENDAVYRMRWNVSP